MLKEKVFEVVPWPINGFSGIGGSNMAKTNFVCSIHSLCREWTRLKRRYTQSRLELEENLIVSGPSLLLAFQNMISEMVREAVKKFKMA